MIKIKKAQSLTQRNCYQWLTFDDDFLLSDEGRLSPVPVVLASIWVVLTGTVVFSLLNAFLTVGSHKSTLRRSFRRFKLAVSRMLEAGAVVADGLLVDGGVCGAFSCIRRTSARWLKRIVTIWRTTIWRARVCWLWSAYSHRKASKSWRL